MLFESLTRGVEEFGMMRFIRAQFGEARQWRGLELIGGDASWRGVASIIRGEGRRGIEVEGIVFNRHD